MNTSNYSFLVFFLPNIHGLSMKIVLKSGLDVHSHLQLRDVVEGFFPVWLEASHMLRAALPLFIPRNCPVSHFSSLGLVGILSAWLPGQPFNPEWGLQVLLSSPWGRETSHVRPAWLWAAGPRRTAAVEPSCHEWWAMTSQLCRTSPPKMHMRPFPFSVHLHLLTEASPWSSGCCMDFRVFMGLSVPSASCSLAKETCWITTGGQILWPELAFDGVSEEEATGRSILTDLWGGVVVSLGREQASSCLLGCYLSSRLFYLLLLVIEKTPRLLSQTDLDLKAELAD